MMGTILGEFHWKPQFDRENAVETGSEETQVALEMGIGHEEAFQS
jgi:hypothetical protein